MILHVSVNAKPDAEGVWPLNPKHHSIINYHPHQTDKSLIDKKMQKQKQKNSACDDEF